jgi:two-component system, LytTR family, response regulator LytT
MEVLIVEDEHLAAARLTGLLLEVDPTIHIAGTVGSVVDAVAWLRANTPDLVFLDIQLSDGLSFDIFSAIRLDRPVIFTTAYDQYALRAFKVNSVDYLLKPVRADDLRESLMKLRGFTRALQPDMDALLRGIRGDAPQYKRRFLIQFGEKMRKVETAEIAFFHTLLGDVYLTTVAKQCYPVDLSLDALEEVLDPQQFFRINRKMIVSFDAIHGMVPYSRSRLRLALEPPEPHDIEALVSVERAAAFRAWMDS